MSDKAEKTSRKITTKDALMHTALRLVAEGSAFSNLSLREVAKETGVVPAAFYRHFKGMDVLGNALVEQSFEVLRQILIKLLSRENVAQQNMETFIRAYIDDLENNIAYLRFVVTEFFSGSSKLRSSVRKELKLLQSSIATDIALLYPEKDLSRDDLHLLAEMCVQFSVTMAKKVLDSYEAHDSSVSEEDNDKIVRVLARQLQIILLGIHHWDNKR